MYDRNPRPCRLYSFLPLTPPPPPPHTPSIIIRLVMYAPAQADPRWPRSRSGPNGHNGSSSARQKLISMAQRLFARRASTTAIALASFEHFCSFQTAVALTQIILAGQSVGRSVGRSVGPFSCVYLLAGCVGEMRGIDFNPSYKRTTSKHIKTRLGHWVRATASLGGSEAVITLLFLLRSAGRRCSYRRPSSVVSSSITYRCAARDWLSLATS